MKNSRNACWLVVALGLTLSAGSARATLFTSKAATTNDWSEAAAWTNNAVPGNGDDVEITNAGSVVFLSSSSSNLHSLLLGRTLVFTNWASTLSASSVTILTNGVMTLPAAFTEAAGLSNNIVIACSNLTVNPGGSIHATALGYLGGVGSVAGYGPGKGTPSIVGAGHGGYGGKDPTSGGGKGNPGGSPYDSTNQPVQPGSGGGGYSGQTAGSGGGAVRVIATGTVTINGTIAANGGNGTAAYAGGGSGGSIWITCATIAGTNGVVSANGGAASGASNWGGGGGGGRIAIEYAPSAQAGIGKPRITFTASQGVNGLSATAAYGTPGTLYFQDGAVLDGAWFPHSGQLCFSAPEWNPDSLLVNNVWVRFPMPGFRLGVSNDLVVKGASGRLDLGGDAYRPNAVPGGVYPGELPYYYTATTSMPALQVGGNLTLTNGGALYVFAGVTNAATADYAALVRVFGDVFICTNSWIYPYSHPFNGGSPLFHVANLTVATPNSGFQASGRGYSGGTNGPGGAGYGPGRGVNFGAGAGYGGSGGRSGGGPYGSSNAPIDGGSGSYMYHPSESYGRGGGLIRIEADQTITLEGQLSANGNNGGASTYDGGGAGGGIYISTRRFAGTGSLAANGGIGSTGASRGGGGGGGRIAVRCMSLTFSGTTSVTNGAGATPDATAGTMVWGKLPDPGTIITIR